MQPREELYPKRTNPGKEKPGEALYGEHGFWHNQTGGGTVHDLPGNDERRKVYRIHAAANQDQPRKVYLILLIRVLHSKIVKEWAEQNKDRISLYFLPSYSQEKNPDEYLNCDLKQG